MDKDGTALQRVFRVDAFDELGDALGMLRGHEILPGEIMVLRDKTGVFDFFSGRIDATLGDLKWYLLQYLPDF